MITKEYVLKLGFTRKICFIDSFLQSTPLEVPAGVVNRASSSPGPAAAELTMISPSAVVRRRSRPLIAVIGVASRRLAVVPVVTPRVVLVAPPLIVGGILSPVVVVVRSGGGVVVVIVVFIVATPCALVVSCNIKMFRGGKTKYVPLTELCHLSRLTSGIIPPKIPR